MPELDHLKHEEFAREVIKHKGNATQAYASVYKGVQPQTANSNGTTLLKNASIRNRVRELMEETGIGIANLTKTLQKHVLNTDDARISLDATKFGFKLHGAVDTNENQSQSNNHLHLHINDVEQLSSGDKLSKLRDLIG